MFVPSELTPSMIADALTVLRDRKVCAYGSMDKNHIPDNDRWMCDCKYCQVIDGKIEVKDIGHGHETGNGCCELAVAVHLLRSMTKKDYQRLLKKKPKDGSRIVKVK